jgi:hypothetical protein
MAIHFPPLHSKYDFRFSFAYASGMRLQVSIQDFPTHTCVIFIDKAAQKQVGPMLCLRSEEKLWELLKKCSANRETVSIVEMALAQRRPCMIDVTLTDLQVWKLRMAERKR